MECLLMKGFWYVFFINRKKNVSVWFGGVYDGRWRNWAGFALKWWNLGNWQNFEMERSGPLRPMPYSASPLCHCQITLFKLLLFKQLTVFIFLSISKNLFILKLEFFPQCQCVVSNLVFHVPTNDFQIFCISADINEFFKCSV